MMMNRFVVDDGEKKIDDEFFLKKLFREEKFRENSCFGLCDEKETTQ